jgi:hypothetical protein
MFRSYDHHQEKYINIFIIYIYIYKWMDVCMFEHNSGRPGAISTKLGTHIAICMNKSLMYILYIFRREDGVGGREFG